MVYEDTPELVALWREWADAQRGWLDAEKELRVFEELEERTASGGLILAEEIEESGARLRSERDRAREHYQAIDARYEAARDAHVEHRDGER